MEFLFSLVEARMEERTPTAEVSAAKALCNYENKPRLVLITKKLLLLARSARTSFELYLIG